MANFTSNKEDNIERKYYNVGEKYTDSIQAPFHELTATDIMDSLQKNTGFS